MPKTRETMIAHLKGREKLLRPLGFTGLQAEWITLVCLHSGLFTRDQAGAFLRLAPRTARDFVHALLETRISGRLVADAQTVDGRWIYRIFSKTIYRELGITNVRHRREASIEVMRRRLLSLDFVLDHLDLPWLATEQEKVACFEQLGIDPGWEPIPNSTPGGLPTATFGTSSGSPAAVSRSLPLPGSSIFWTALNASSTPGSPVKSAPPRKKSSCSARPSMRPIGRPLNLLAASMPP